MIKSNSYDVIVVGGSIAGCVTALDLADHDLNVALVEKRMGLDHYKKICSHIIHPAGVKTLRRLGFQDTLTSQSSLSTYMDIASAGQSVSFPLGKQRTAANIERKDLDPLLKAAVDQHSHIQTFWGSDVRRLNEVGGRVAGISLQKLQGDLVDLTASLVVAADGRQSQIAKLDHAKRKVIDNQRVALFAYFEPTDQFSESKVWTEDLGRTYIGCFPNRSHLLITCYLPTNEYELIKQDVQAFFNQQILSFVNQMGIQLGEQETPVIVAKDTSTSAHHSRSRNLAYVGDAYLAADPLTGVGCSWAMTSSELLTKAVVAPLKSNQQTWVKNARIDFALAKYRWYHKIRYQLPAILMSLASAKGDWFFHPRLYKLASKISNAKWAS